MRGGNGQEGFVVGVTGLFLLILLGIEVCSRFIVRVVKQLFGILAPRAKVVLIENDQIPIVCVDKLVLCLYATGLVGTQQILERTEHHNGLRLIGTGIFPVNIDVLSSGVFVRNKLPAIKVHMGHKVLAPGGLYRRLKGQHEDSGKTHLLGQFVRSKGFAETHFSVPKELRRPAGVFFLGIGVILHGALYCGILLRAHFEDGCAGGLGDNALLQLHDSGFYIRHRAVIPLVAILALVELPKSFPAQNAVDIFICKDRTIRTHGGLGVQKVGFQPAGVHLFFDAGLHIPVCIADFYVSRVIRHLGEVIDIYGRSNFRALDEENSILHFSAPHSITGISSSIAVISLSVSEYFLYRAASSQV